MPGAAALDAIERASGDADPGVRSRAAELFGTREETRGIQLVEKVLSDDGDADVRVAALRGLLPRLPDAAAVRLFERAASNDSAKTVRDYALAALRRS